MNNNYEDLIKNKINNYMEQIEVPKNLGGIIMEDYGKIKNEEVKKSNQTNDQELNNKPKNNKNKVLMGSVAAVSAAVLVGAGVLVGSRFFGNKNITINGNSGQNSGMVSPNEENVVEENKVEENNVEVTEVVSDLHNYKGKSNDEYKYEIEYIIPKINIQSNYANEINEKIKKKFEKHLENKWDGIFSIGYEYFTNKDIVSVAIKRVAEGGGTDYDIYNINKSTGEKVSNNEIIAEVGMTSSQFSEKLKTAAKNSFIKKYGTKEEYKSEIEKAEVAFTAKEIDEQVKWYEKQYNNTISDNHCKLENCKVYLNGSKEIIVCINEFALAGSNEDEYCINLNKNVELNSTGTDSSQKTDFNNNGNNNTSIFDNASSLSYTNNIKDDINGKTALLKIGEQGFKTEVKDGYYIYTDLFSKSYYIKSIDSISSKFQMMGNNDWAALFKCIVNYTDKDGQKKSFDVAVVVKSDDYAPGIMGTFDNYCGSTSFVRSFTDLYSESEELTSEEKQTLEAFLNKPANNPWILINYDNPKDIFTHQNKHSADEILRYSVKLGGFTKWDSTIWDGEGGNVASQEDMNRFFKHYLGENPFTDEEIQKAFKYDYNKQKAGMYAFWVTDTSLTPTKIESSDKIENEYYLKLNHGQKVKLIKKDGTYYFYSCEGYDGTIGQ